MESEKQILKCHNDQAPISFAGMPESPELFKLSDSATCPWIKPDEKFGPAQLRSRIEPWLTALFQSEHLALLAGSGLTHAVHGISTGTPLPGMGEVKFTNLEGEINNEANKSAIAAGREKGNIEDQIRVANELLRGLEILSLGDAPIQKKAEELKKDIEKIIKEFADSILKGENELIAATTTEREKAFNYLVSFLMSFASRTGTRDRLQIFTTNYDRFIEAGAEAAGLHLLDRFVGSLAPIFRSSRLDVDMHYNPPGIRGGPRYLEGVAKFTKLHGAIDWININGNILRMGLPFGTKNLGPYLNAPGFAEAEAMKLMIYPNSAKDRETAAYPYVELFRDFAAAVCRPNNTLVTFGYSFGDEHINRVVEDMLTIPSTHLVIISYSDPLGRIMKLYEKIGRPAQITLLIGNHLGDFQTLVDNYLPKPAIDKTTFRMTELLKSRWNTGASKVSDEDAKQNGKGGAD
jgi:hypothetical protein